MINSFPDLEEKERLFLKKLMRVTREQPPFWTYARVQRLIFAIAVSVFVMLLSLIFEGTENQHCQICEYGTLKAINGRHLITVCTTNKKCDGYVSNKILMGRMHGHSKLFRTEAHALALWCLMTKEIGVLVFNILMVGVFPIAQKVGRHRAIFVPLVFI
ncbi:hypothetical protein HF325_003801 [Metschnikowia pulcherrima]|uniref:Uncharacterized protein n=1 Tax=Metschnikowia pulcherrima TaxID=27326 RepID=A0A8H7GQK0_9ASCO|nr:hypothetical protein HF325_003801 [Metschnikowia pulcherrima]